MTADSLRNVCLAQIAAGKTAWVTALRDKALERISNGGGQIQVIESGGANGKNFAGRNLMDCVRVAEITQAALDESGAAGDEPVSGTNLDFRDLLCGD